MYKRILGIAAVCLLALSVSNAFAQQFAYSVKFVCGVSESDPQKSIVQPGFYSTEINISNYRFEDVEIRKKFLILVQDGEAIGREPEFVQPSGEDAIVLPTMTATMDDCVRVSEITGVDTSILTIGYLLLYSTQDINVDAVYTATGREGQSLSIDVERVEGDRLD